MSNEDAATAVQGMKQSVAAGELFLEHGVTEACAGHCDTLMSEIDGVRAMVKQAQAVSGFGAFQSGAQLQVGFQAKASNTVDFLVTYANVIGGMRENFRAAGVAYAQQDSSTSGLVQSVGEEIPG